MELSYQRRLDFPDLVSLQFSYELPIFTANRQDRSLAAKLAERDNRVEMHRDHQRQLAAELNSFYAEWVSSRERIARYQNTVLPQSDDRIKAVLAAYRANKADLTQVIDARRAQTELGLQVLGLQVARARAEGQLEYLSESAKHHE